MYAISHYRYGLELLTGVGGKRRLLSGGTEFLSISSIVLFALVFIILARLLQFRLRLQ